MKRSRPKLGCRAIEEKKLKKKKQKKKKEHLAARVAHLSGGKLLVFFAGKL